MTSIERRCFRRGRRIELGCSDDEKPQQNPAGRASTKKINNLDSRKINKAIQNTHKIEKIINQYGYEVENAKRYLVSIKKLLEF